MPELDYQIPNINGELLTTSLESIDFDFSDVRSDEPLVRLDDYDIAYESYHARTDGKNPPFNRSISACYTVGWLRKSLAERLAVVNEDLRPFGAELLILDAYRSKNSQHAIWQFYYDEFYRLNGDATPKQAEVYAANFARDVRSKDFTKTPYSPAHMSGAAIDCTLRSLTDGKLLDMGTCYEQIVEASRTDYYEQLLQAGLIEIDNLVLFNRRLMHWALSKQGILNEPSLYWHHDWGNTYWYRTYKAKNGKALQLPWYSYCSEPQSNSVL